MEEIQKDLNAAIEYVYIYHRYFAFELFQNHPSRHQQMTHAKGMIMQFLKSGKKEHMCKLCDRKMSDTEWDKFEAKVSCGPIDSGSIVNGEV